MSYSWAKLSIDTLDDRVIASLPDSLWRRYHELLLIAKAEDADGILPPVLDMAWTLRPITADALQADLAYLAKCGLAELVLLDDGEEAWLLTRYVESQTAMTSTERSRRRRQRAAPVDDEPPPQPGPAPAQRTRNADATPMQRTRNETLPRLRLDKDKRQDEEGEGEGQSGAIAPAPATPLPPIPFQPIPETVIAAKRRRGDPEPSAAVPNAPPGVALLHRLTNYWPGADITPALADRLGDAPDEAALARAVELWRLSGNKPTNCLGILDWYDELRRNPAWTPQARFKANGRAAPAPTVSTPAPGSQPVTW